MNTQPATEIAAEYATAVTRLQARLTNDISIVSAMGVKIIGYDGAALRLSAPLDKNFNDKGTGFAGSIASLAALSGWALLSLRMDAEFGRSSVAIFHCDLSYDRPVTGDFQSLATVAEPGAIEALIERLQTRRSGKIAINAQVIEGEHIRARLKAQYAVHIPRAGKAAEGAAR